MSGARDIVGYCADEDIKFVKLTFCDALGRQKNVSILTSELERAFESGIAFDASAIRGYENETRSDLFLYPDPDTLIILPWRPEQQQAAKILCSVRRPDGSLHECDPRSLLKNAVVDLSVSGISLTIGAEHEFTVYGADNNALPADHAEYLDIPPTDNCSDIRRQVCLNLERMGIASSCSHHSYGAGQNTVAFEPVSALRAADTAMTADTAIRTAADGHQLYADTGTVRYSITVTDGDAEGFIRAVESRIHELERFLAPAEGTSAGFRRSDNVRTMQITTNGSNPYIALTLIIYAGTDPDANFIEKHLPKQITAIYS